MVLWSPNKHPTPSLSRSATSEAWNVCGLNYPPLGVPILIMLPSLYKSNTMMFQICSTSSRRGSTHTNTHTFLPNMPLSILLKTWHLLSCLIMNTLKSSKSYQSHLAEVSHQEEIYDFLAKFRILSRCHDFLSA